MLRAALLGGAHASSGANACSGGGWCGLPAGQAGPIRTSAGLSGVRPDCPDAVRPGRTLAGLVGRGRTGAYLVGRRPASGAPSAQKNDVSQKRPERAASLNLGVFTFWNLYVGRRPAWSDWRAGGRPVVGLAGRGRPPAGLVGRWPAWPDAVRRGWTASGVVGSSRPLVCTSLQRRHRAASGSETLETTSSVHSAETSLNCVPAAFRSRLGPQQHVREGSTPWSSQLPAQQTLLGSAQRWCWGRAVRHRREESEKSWLRKGRHRSNGLE